MVKSGFTLVELLVVIAIISILSAVGAVIFTEMMKNSRDQARWRDLNAVKQALELYRNEKHFYPLFLSNLVPEYLESTPSDQVEGRSYRYEAAPAGCNTTDRNCTGFVFCAKKEASSSFGSLPEQCGYLNCEYVTDCNMGVESN